MGGQQENNEDQLEKEKALVEKYIDLELKLASYLQHHRLASFKPRILALALISLELEKQQEQEPEMNIDWLASISYLQRLAKVIDREGGGRGERREDLTCFSLEGGEWCIVILSGLDRSSLTVVQGCSIGTGRSCFYLPCFKSFKFIETTE